MKLTAYLVAANFGANLYVNAAISTDPTNACSVIVDEFRRQLPPDTPPLTRIIWCELAEEFLVKALAGMRGELLPSGEQTKVVALRPVEPPPAEPKSLQGPPISICTCLVAAGITSRHHQSCPLYVPEPAA